MKYQSALKWLIPIMGVLALIAASAGIFDQTPKMLVSRAYFSFPY
jgi:hypothetical protein